MGARKNYNPKNKGKKSYQPILTFVAETGNISAGVAQRRSATGAQIARHLEAVLPPCRCVRKIFGGLMLVLLLGCCPGV